ncbi:hypothetical protein ACPV5Q_14640 [Vibrio astriarenae]
MTLITNEEIQYCTNCNDQTKHIIVLVRDEPKPKHKLLDFFIGFVRSSAVGGFHASMDDFSRHAVCEKCGNKVINDNMT